MTSIDKPCARPRCPWRLSSRRRPRPRNSPDLARLKAHLTAVQTMTANFTQTDAKGRTDRGTLQLKRPGAFASNIRAATCCLLRTARR